METEAPVSSVNAVLPTASFIGSGINGNSMAVALMFSSPTTKTASFIGSGINGNSVTTSAPLMVIKTASFIGSGINGNLIFFEYL